MFPLEKQVCCRELAEKLKELGVKQDSLRYWDGIGNLYYKKGTGRGWAWRLLDDTRHDGTTIEGDFHSAFTVAELGEMLPHALDGTDGSILQMNRMPGANYWWYLRYGINGHSETAETEADCRAKMLIWLIENGHVKVEEL